MTINYRHLFIVISIYVIITPVFEQYIGAIGNILVNGVVTLFFLIFIVMIPKNIYYCLNRDIKIRIFSYFIIFYLLTISMASISGILFAAVNPILRDVFEFHKPILYLSIIIFTYYVMVQNQNFLSMQKYLNIIFILIVIISLFQLMGSRDVTLLYTASNIFESKRLTIPFGNPYDYAFVIIFFCFLYFFKYASGQLRYLIPLLISLFLLLETGSRSVFLSLLILTFFFIPLILFFSKFPRKFKYYLIAQLFVFIFFIYFFIDIDRFYQNYIFLFEQFVQLYTSQAIGDSAEARLEQFIYVYKRALTDPMILLFGNGPAKSVIDYSDSGALLYMEHVESSITYLLYRYGIIGIVCFSLIYLSALVVAIQNSFIVSNNRTTYCLTLAIICWLISIPFSSIGGMYIEQPKVSYLFYMLISYSFAINFKFRNIKLKT